MNVSGKQIIIFGIIIVVIISGILIILFGRKPAPPEVKLVIWGFEPKNNFSGIIEAYQKVRPNVSIIYEEISKDNYNQKVLNALASAQGPDIFFIQSKTLISNISKLYPAPQTQINLATLRQNFPQVVEDDFVYNGNIYALPLYIDSLALFYNEDYFNKAQIVYPPKTWDEFVDDSQKLKILDTDGNIVQAGAGIGSSEKNVVYATDILKLLMKQAGIQVFSKDLYADFGARGDKPIGSEILNFYTSFSNPQTTNYTWPKYFENSIDAFASGKVAMILGYNEDISKILSKNPYLNFKIAPVPQFKDAKINYAYSNYWGLGVSLLSKNPSWAWDFIIYATMSAPEAYISISKKPPAFKPLISKYLSNPDFGVFSSLALIARSWQEPDLNKVREILNNAIDGVINYKINSIQAIKLAEEQVNQIVRNY